MSVVAWDGKTLAADCAGTESYMTRISRKMRVICCGERVEQDDATGRLNMHIQDREGPKVVLSAVGDAEAGMVLMDWYEAGAEVKDWPSFQEDRDNFTRLIVATCWGVFQYDQLPIAQPVTDPFMAWGSGRDFAMGALARGANARDAVLVTNRFSTVCGHGVDSCRIK